MKITIERLVEILRDADRQVEDFQYPVPTVEWVHGTAYWIDGYIDLQKVCDKLNALERGTTRP